MGRLPIILIACLLFGCSAGAQNTKPVFGGDTIRHTEYYKSRQLKIFDSYITQTPQIEYTIKKWYTRAGNLILFDSIDASRNILFIGVYRKDGSTQFELEEHQPNYEIRYSDRNSQVTDIYSGRMNERLARWQKFENSQLLFDSTYNRFYNTALDTVKYFEKVIVKSNKQISENYEMSSDSKFTLEKHIRMVYNMDSVLLTEGVYKTSVKYCGYFLQYYPDGSLSCIGEYDKRGLKTDDWYYFDEKGNLIKREHYYRSVNLFK